MDLFDEEVRLVFYFVDKVIRRVCIDADRVEADESSARDAASHLGFADDEDVLADDFGPYGPFVLNRFGRSEQLAQTCAVYRVGHV